MANIDLTLTEFLLARILEEEDACARAVAAGGTSRAYHKYRAEAVVMSPDRFLAEREVKRQIVDWVNERDLDWPLRLLAGPYADHPDWRHEWTPDDHMSAMAWGHRFVSLDDSDECGACGMSRDEEVHHA